MNKELATLLFPNTKNTPEYYLQKYQPRDLKDGAIVSRFAPSPTGFVHMGSLLSAYIASFLPNTTNGIFYLRVEDTDQKRSIENGITGIINDLNHFEIKIDEGMMNETEEKGNYGPYIQSKRQEIYKCFAKYLVEQDLAYPCFCSEEELEEIREIQQHQKDRIGYYGKYAKCRNLSFEEIKNKILNKENYIIRLKSPGNFDKKIVFKDLVRGEITFNENDLDVVIIKSDHLPTYHFAHVIDDYLMGTTHVLRGEEWISSIPIHLQLCQVLNIKPAKYAHLGLLMKIDENGTKRKLSKRKDPEASVNYYYQRGIPIEAVKLYLMTIANSNFEQWYENSKNKEITEFKFDFKKVSTSGSLFDLEKLLNISKNYLSRLSAKEVYNNLLKWTKQFDYEFYQILSLNQEYSIDILNIEREKKKPRKDFASYSDIKEHIWYMYQELFYQENINYHFDKINDKEEITRICAEYLNNYYDEKDNEQEWFDKIKLLAEKMSYAKEIKDYNENPSVYKGHVGDVAMVIRVVMTTLTQTPNLYSIMNILGYREVKERILFCIKHL